MNELEAHLYDVDGKEVIIPSGYNIVMGIDSYCFVKAPVFDSELVYQPERLNPKGTDNSACDSLNNANT